MTSLRGRGGRSGGLGLTVVAALTVPAVGPTSAAAVAPEFTASPTSLQFPATFVGASSTIDIVVANNSGSAQTPNFAGGAPLDPGNFGGSQNCAGKTFAPGDSCTFTYEFHPATAGQHSSSTTISVDGENFAISLAGNGLEPFSVAPTTLSFPDVAVGSTSSLDVVVTNLSPVSQSPNFSGGAPLDPQNFGGSQNCAGKTFAPGDTCTFTYEFHPVTEGALSSSTTIGVDGANFSIAMSGTGVSSSATTTTATTPTGDATTSTTPTGDPTPDTTGDVTGGGDPTTDDAPDGPTATAPTGRLEILPGPLPPGSPATVIAQGIVTFGDADVAWEHDVLDVANWPYSFDRSPPAFVVDDGPDALLVTEIGGSAALLDAGEAVLVPPGSSGTVGPLFDGAVAGGHQVALVGAEGDGSFRPGPGRRDVNLVRGVIEPGETMTVRSPFPILVVVTEGELVDTVDGDAARPAGTSATLGPHVELRNDGSEPATVVAAAVGAPVP